MNSGNLKLSAIFIAILYLSSTAFTFTDLPRSKGKWVTYESEDDDRASLDSFFTQMGVHDAPYEDYFLEDNKGSKALITIDELGITVDYRVVIIGQQQIQTVVVMRSNQWDQKVVNKFFKSLKLLK